jgi:hypothetical protein
MKVLDTNAVNFILKYRLSLKDDYCVTDDIKEEIEIAETVLGRKLSSRVGLASNSEFFDMAHYVANYKDMLNKHGGRSFYNMTGFGDISILALLKTVEAVLKDKTKGRLFGPSEEIEIFTDDKPLIKKITKESNKTKISKNIDIK